ARSGGHRRRRARGGGGGWPVQRAGAARTWAERGARRAARRRGPAGDPHRALPGSPFAHPRFRHPLEEPAAVIALLLAAVTISADPARVQLGETARVRLRIEAPSQPRLSASAGRIEGLRAEGGRWIADYLPPDSSLPQMALISALAGDEVGFLGLPLWGAGAAVVRTRPGGRIEVRIGQERFGPAIADARGIAVVPVDGPPRVFAAMHGKEAVDVQV